MPVSNIVKSKKEIHAEKVKEVYSRYREAGYEVIVDPLHAQIPFDLAGYQPDLVATKENQGIIVEVMLSSSRTWREKLQEAVEKVRKQDNWRFVLVTADDSLPDALPGIAPDFLSWQGVSQQLDRADRLQSLGETDAAYFTLWIAFEYMMRLRVQEILPLLDRLSPEILIRQLDDCGELSVEQYNLALACRETHHLVVHGFPVNDLAARFDRLRELVQDLAIEWRNAQEGQDEQP